MAPKVKKLVNSYLILLALVACSAPPTATIPPSPEPINVSISPFLEPVNDALHVCAINLPGIALFVETIPASTLNFNDYDLIIWWGEKPEEIALAFPLYEDELVVIINSYNPNIELNSNELIALFNGRVDDWIDISLYDQPVSVWTYPLENKTTDAFRSVILKDQSFSRLAHLAPSPQAMLEAIAGDPGGIGYVPKSWLSADVSPSLIEPELQNALRKPILALVNSEPRGNIHDLLSCLQTGLGQDQLSKYYSATN